MKHLLIIGAGGVSRVATVKSAMTMAKGEAFSKITLASRTKSKCDEIAAFIKERVGVDIATAEVNADDTSVLSANITLPEFTEVGELTIQAFLWDSVSGMVPLCGATPLIAQ